MRFFVNSPFLFTFLGVWLLLTLLVLWFGIAAGSHAGGEVAFQMFILGLPSSIGVGALLNAVDTPRILPSRLSVLEVWLPYFLGAVLQFWLLLWVKFTLRKSN